MSDTSQNAYRDACETAKASLDQLIDEVERLKRRQITLVRASQALTAMIAARTEVPPAPTKPLETAARQTPGPLQAQTAAYIHEGRDADEEIQRRIQLAIS